MLDASTVVILQHLIETQGMTPEVGTEALAQEMTQRLGAGADARADAGNYTKVDTKNLIQRLTQKLL